MKSIQHTLAILTTTFTLSASAQFQLNITGTVANAPGIIQVYVYMTGDDSLTNIFTIVDTDVNGNFSYTNSDFTTGGLAWIQLPCNGMISDTQYQEWTINSFVLNFDFIYCDFPVVDCNASFWAWNDSLSNDSINIDPFNVYIINNSTGTNLSYSWDFGDGSTSTDPYPNHYYETTGTYTLCLIVQSDNCADTLCMTFTVDENGIFDGGGAAQQGFNLNIVADIAEGVDENKNALGTLLVFPNPVSENSRVNIEATHAYMATVELYNMQGQKLMSIGKRLQRGNNQLPLEINGLASGNYLLRLMDENGNTQSTLLSK